MSDRSDIRVLFVAPDCNPKWHSLPALIAEYYQAIFPRVHITLVTQVRNEPNLGSFLPSGAEVVYLDTERVERPVHRFAQAIVGDPNKAMTLQVALRYPSSIYFEYGVWRRFKDELRQGRYDVVHRASPMSPTTPSVLSAWSPVPVVIGPVLGGLPWPDAFKGEMMREREWMNYVRPAHRLMPFYRATYRNAAAILAAYPHTVSDIPPEDHDRVIDFSEGGVWADRFPLREFRPYERATILFVGRMVPFKQPEVLVRAFERSPALQRHRLVMVGDGPELPRLKEIVESAGLSGCVELTGALPFSRVLELMYEANVFAFPSIREQGGGVLTLASMASTPSVVVDYGGPSHRVPKGCGIRVPLGDFESLIASFVRELETLMTQPERLVDMGRAAREHAERFYDWSRKAAKTVEVYEWVLNRRSSKPDYWS